MMNPSMQKVTYYIETHLDDELDVTNLAKVAGYSHYHFCRIFKVHVGESAMSYATRLRLERASSELMLGEKSVIEVALDAGYQTPTGFLKAFKTRFGTTPTAYKKGAKTALKIYKDETMNTPEIVTREVANVVFTRELGEYIKSSCIAWKRLSADLNGLEEKFKQNPPKEEITLGIGSGEALGICHDDPQVTDEENIRYDAAIAWGEKEVSVLSEYGFETKTVAGGRYATVTYKGTKESEKAWYGLYTWVEEQGHTFRDEPAFEKYIDALEVAPDKITTEVYVPIV